MSTFFTPRIANDMMSTPDIRISIAIVTRNRISSLERALCSWRRQSVQPFEIVISDDSDPEHASTVEQLAATYDCRYGRGPRKGLYANRNHVVQYCSGSHILTADDDHEHPSDYLEKIQMAVRKEPNTVWCMGELYSWQDFEKGMPWYGPGQMSSHGSLCTAPKDSVSGCWAISDGATLYPREIFDCGFRFYDGMRFGDSYKEFGCLLFNAGWRISVLNQTGVIHHLAEVGRSYDDRLEEGAATFFAMFMFSFYYQPRFTNVMITVSKIAKTALRHPFDGWCILSRALTYYRGRKKQVRSWRQQREENSQTILRGT
jgi:glycosyltransferase involved in cell wall biosynthesis